MKNGIPTINTGTGRNLRNIPQPENSIKQKIRGHKLRSTMARDTNNKAKNKSA